MKINPNPKCSNCANHREVFIDGLYGCKLLGGHDMCILPQEPLEGYTALGTYYDEYCIDGFWSGGGECQFYKN
jgi:hypothetical protein